MSTLSLFELTAADLMTAPVLVIPREMSLKAAARILSRAAVTGAPVVDSLGVCRGVLSATDFLQHMQDDDEKRRRLQAECTCAHSAWQLIDVDALPADEVGSAMTADPVTVTPATPIGDMARIMCDAHIHRVVVVDTLERPIGMVSMTDLVAALHRAASSAALASR